MRFFAEAIQALGSMPMVAAALWATLGNVVVFGVTLASGHLLIALYRNRPVSEPPEPLSWAEIMLAGSCVVLNSGVAILGIILWRAGIIQVRFAFGVLTVLADLAVFFLAMDFAMYVLHRIAHLAWLYPFVHRTHHRYENPRPLTLFVLNPFETISFGFLWLMVISLYDASWLGMVLYLTLNLAFGLIGHLGVEPMPGAWLKIPVIRYISTSTFHAEHHQDKDHNYGFYTLIWDRLFGTLSPDYQQDFVMATAEAR